MWPPPVRWPPARGPRSAPGPPRCASMWSSGPVLVSRSVGGGEPLGPPEHASPRGDRLLVSSSLHGPRRGSGWVQPRGGVAPVLHQGATPSWWTGRSRWNEPTALQTPPPPGAPSARDSLGTLDGRCGAAARRVRTFDSIGQQNMHVAPTVTVVYRLFCVGSRGLNTPDIVATDVDPHPPATPPPGTTHTDHPTGKCPLLLTVEAPWKNCSNSDGNYRTSTLLNTNCCRPTTNRGGPTRLKISWSMRQTAGPGRHLLQILHCPQESTDNLRHVRLHMSEKSRMETCGRKKPHCSTHNPTEPFCGNLSD
ncbi:unnamed protein product [Boreogadus saida]